MKIVSKSFYYDLLIIILKAPVNITHKIKQNKTCPIITKGKEDKKRKNNCTCKELYMFLNVPICLRLSFEKSINRMLRTLTWDGS